jgi:hypothetical protein
MDLGLTLLVGYCGFMTLCWLRSGWRGKTIHTHRPQRTVELHRVRRTGRPAAAHN